MFQKHPLPGCELYDQGESIRTEVLHFFHLHTPPRRKNLPAEEMFVDFLPSNKKGWEPL